MELFWLSDRQFARLRPLLPMSRSLSAGGCSTARQRCERVHVLIVDRVVRVTDYDRFTLRNSRIAAARGTAKKCQQRT